MLTNKPNFKKQDVLAATNKFLMMAKLYVLLRGGSKFFGMYFFSLF